MDKVRIAKAPTETYAPCGRKKSSIDPTYTCGAEVFMEEVAALIATGGLEKARQGRRINLCTASDLALKACFNVARLDPDGPPGDTTVLIEKSRPKKAGKGKAAQKPTPLP